MIHSFRFKILEPLKGKKKIMGKKQHLKNTDSQEFSQTEEKTQVTDSNSATKLKQDEFKESHI